MSFDLLFKSTTPGGASANGVHPGGQTGRPADAAPVPLPAIDQEALRRTAWEIGSHRAAEQFVPEVNHVGLAMVTPHQGLAHWRILPRWIDETARVRGPAWTNCRLILRLYDVSLIEFNGSNAHRIQDVNLPAIAGHLFFQLPRAGTWQLGEVGFLLRNGEFIPAARSQVAQFASDSVSPRHEHTALLVDEHFEIEEVGNLWEQERVLQQRRKPKLRVPLRFAAFAFDAPVCGLQGLTARFAAELAAQQVAGGHEAHLFVPACPQLATVTTIDGVVHHPLEVKAEGSPVERALAFGRAAELELRRLPAFDLFHLHEWMTGLGAWVGSRPTVLSLTSIESTRLNGAPMSELSQEIHRLERELAHGVDALLTPDWLRARTIAEFGLDEELVHAFPMEAHLPDEWTSPLDVGKVKMSVGFGPLDQVLLFVGPLEWDPGPDLMIEALPTLLNRCPRARLAFAGSGSMHGHLEHLAREKGLSYAVRVLGHIDRWLVVQLMRSADALVLPSRHRVPMDEAVVDLARRAGRPVVTTHGGPAHLVRHEQTGLVVFDNPNSLVWALERVTRETSHAWQMGQAGLRQESSRVSWAEVARRYLELCGDLFPELTEPKEKDEGEKAENE